MSEERPPHSPAEGRNLRHRSSHQRRSQGLRSPGRALPRRTVGGLYMARHADHPPRFHYLESWIIPELGIRASILHFTPPEHIRDWDFYVDIGDFIRGDQVWTSEDHYLDLIVQTGRSVELLDVDELLEANTAGILDPKTSERAMLNAARAIEASPPTVTISTPGSPRWACRSRGAEWLEGPA